MKRVKIRPDKHPRYPFLLHWSEGGVERRKYAATEKEARAEAARLEASLRHTAPADTPVTPEERRALMLARDRKVPLLEAVEHWVTTRGRARATTVKTLCATRLEEAQLDPLSDRYRVDLQNMLPRIAEALGALPAADCTPQVLATYLRARGAPATQRKYKAILSGVFASAVRAGILPSNPCAVVRVAREAVGEAPGILAPEQAARWLACVALEAPALLSGVAISLFAGLRQAEVARLDWSEVRLDRGHIEVTAGKSKTRTRRLVEIMPNLAEWLQPGKGLVWPHTPDRAKDRAVAAYGDDLPRNAARHSFVSYHLALFGDLALTELQAGHDRSVLFRNYRELVTAEQAAEWFTLVPGPCRAASTAAASGPLSAAPSPRSAAGR